MTSPLPPSHAQVLVIGGGPSGSYAAAVLAREGFDVALFEATTFPRYHIGESMIPSVRHLLRFIGAEDKVLAHGFFEKRGAGMRFAQDKKEGYVDFLSVGPNNYVWNVVRSEFDELLLNHAASCGVKVFQATKVTAINFASASSTSSGRGRAASANWTQLRASTGGKAASGTLTFDHLADASGRAGIMSTKCLQNRKINSNLKNMAMWGYWSGCGSYHHGDPPTVAPFFQVLTDKSGWAWFIPLHDGTTSVGIVMNQIAFNLRAQDHLNQDPTAPRSKALLARYLSALDLAPEVRTYINTGVLTKGKGDKATEHINGDSSEVIPIIRTASDFSYSAASYAGEGFRISGDAGAFIDPWFSTGVHLAMTGALSAAASIATVVRGECSEAEAAAFHSQRIAVSYTRLLIVVLSTYQQMQEQNLDVISDIGEDTFDKAFEHLRPLIQGSADVGLRLFETEVQQALDFCSDMFRTAPEDRAVVQRVLNQLSEDQAAAVNATSNGDTRPEATANGLGEDGPLKAGLDVHAPIMPLAALDDLARRVHEKSQGSESSSLRLAQEEARQALAYINARRVVHKDHDSLHNLEEEELLGLVMRLEVGNLGLERTGTLKV
ncbi:hypothetical protein EWM64_g4732 [Hericium alpestre]|uniref:FAD-binding domain-containing protein n=1 Tax=Hericium alpestre TaxID=135208 RepID=A0A4Y9ZZ90_9AGAM|nr:hypothetical protein EWM64_g4732 [Hericium alpestre]